MPRRNLVPKPAALSFEEAACLPTAWLTAYRMLFVRGGVQPGQTVLVQGAGGGVASALIALGRQAGMRVWVTSRDEAKRAKALELGAHEAFETGARLPERVDAVMETVGEATWKHSLRALKPGGTLVVSGVHERRRPARRAPAGVLPPAQRHRLDDGHARRARARRAPVRGDRRAPADRPRRCRSATRARASRRWPRATLFGKIVFQP